MPANNCRSLRPVSRLLDSSKRGAGSKAGKEIQNIQDPSSPSHMTETDRKRKSPRETHQGRVQHNRKRSVAKQNHGQREYRKELGDLPLRGQKETADEDEGDAGEDHEEGPPEAAEHASHLVDKTDLLDLLSGRAPCHVDAEEVGGDGLRHVDWDSSEEYCKHRNPFEVFQYWFVVVSYWQSVLKGILLLLTMDSIRMGKLRQPSF